MATIPIIFTQPNWFTSSFISARLGIPLRTVQHWCQSGFFTRRGCTVILIPNAWRRWSSQYWIHCPKEMSKDAILRRIPLESLDIPTPSASGCKL